METAPARPGNFLLGNVRDLGRDPLEFLTTRFFRRRIMQPVFVHRQVAEFARIMVEQTCLGRDFFLLEAQLVLIMAAQRYRLEVAPGHVAQAEALITQRMRGSLPMVIHRR